MSSVVYSLLEWREPAAKVALILFAERHQFLLFFDVIFSLFSDPVRLQWVPEISHHCPRTPFLLVGTQVDLRDDSNTLEKLAKNKQRALTCESGEKLARELRAIKYVECSALTQVHKLFERKIMGILAS